MTNTAPQVASRRPGRGSLLSRLRSYLFFAPMIYLYTGVMGTLSLLSSLFDRDGRMQHWFARTWARMILKTAWFACASKVSTMSTRQQTAIYAANHLSALDIPCSTPGLRCSSVSWRRRSCSVIRFSVGI